MATPPASVFGAETAAIAPPPGEPAPPDDPVPPTATSPAAAPLASCAAADRQPLDGAARALPSVIDWAVLVRGARQ